MRGLSAPSAVALPRSFVVTALKQRSDVDEDTKHVCRRKRSKYKGKTT